VGDAWDGSRECPAVEGVAEGEEDGGADQGEVLGGGHGVFEDLVGRVWVFKKGSELRMVVPDSSTVYRSAIQKVGG